MAHRSKAVALVVASSLSILACADSIASPGTVTASSTTAAPSAANFADGNATASWIDLTTSLTARRTVSANRLYAYLTLAQLRAAEDVEKVTPHLPTPAAISGASAAILEAYFPADLADIAAALDAQKATEQRGGGNSADFAAGEKIGRAAAARIIAYSLGDGFGLTDPGTPPIGPGSWVWNGGPIARGLLGARPFYLTTKDELRPPPPPTFGSTEFNIALAEVRHVSDTRSAEQLAIAKYWNVNQSLNSLAAISGVAVDLLRRYRTREHESARILFLMYSAVWDAQVGCFDAKYHYWFIRPPQADPAITLPVGLPPHPSYPSAHSCASGASTGVLTAIFPSERGMLQSLAKQASLSRLYAGIHYRFDMEAGVALGRGAAAKALAADLSMTAVR